MHGLFVLAMMFTEQAMVAEDGKRDSAGVLVYDRSWTTLSVALRERVVYVANIQALLRRFG